jgi:hypothetical protein
VHLLHIENYCPSGLQRFPWLVWGCDTRALRFGNTAVHSEVLPDLIAMLHDPEPAVRRTTLHTLACDRCKEGACRPVEAEVLPEALRLLFEDANAHVRAMAIELVGLYVHSIQSQNRP